MTIGEYLKVLILLAYAIISNNDISVNRVNIKMVGDDLIHSGVYKQCY